MTDCYIVSDDVLAEDWTDSDEAAAWEYLSDEALAAFERELDSGAGETNEIECHKYKSPTNS